MKNSFLKNLKKIFIVAEIGVNHEGDVNTAIDLIKKAAVAGVDAVKFQTYNADTYISEVQPERKNRTKKFELSREEFKLLSVEAKRSGLNFFSTPLHFDDIDFLSKFCNIIKISSGDLTHLELIEYAAKKFKKIIVSTGLGKKEEIEDAVKSILKVRPNIRNQHGLVLMHCVSAYPTPLDEVNLDNIRWLKNEFNFPVGYSDHTIGTKACELSVMFGVSVIEKHFTYRKENQAFHDHAISADPKDLKNLVRDVRNAEIIFGSYERKRGKSETNNLVNMRRSYAASTDLKRGKKINETDLILLRPGLGVEPKNHKFLIGKKIKKNIRCGMIIKKNDVY